MDTKNTMQEKISAFADGEGDEGQIDAVLAALRTSEGKAAWEDYHRIGDALRSDDMSFAMSDDFTSKLMARLDDEPAIVAAPRRSAAETVISALGAQAEVKPARRFMLPGMAAAAMAVLTVVVAQQWMGTGHGGTSSAESATTVAMGTSAVSPASVTASTVPAFASAGSSAPRDLKRDPGIDEYLLAHQRFSPSLYSTAQYARTATFAAESDK
jgi:sigma-E factor negative regulatory protein RseA